MKNFRILALPPHLDEHVTLSAAKPRAGMREDDEVLAGHSERVDRTTVAAVRHQRRISLWHLISSIALALLILGSFGFSTAAAAADAPHAVVNTARLNVRQGPGANYSVIGGLVSGDDVTVTGRNAAGSWYRVSLSGGKTGWISAALVKLTGDASGVPVVAAPAASTTKTTAKTGSSSQGSVIVFQMSSGGTIYAMNPDGSGLRALTTGMDPAVSPDGQWVAFTRWQGQTAGALGSLWVIKVDGTGERQVMGFANQVKSPTWSPDGTQIVVSLQHGGRVDVTYMCMVNGAPVQSDEPIDGALCMQRAADPLWALRLVDVATGSYEDLGGDKHSFAPTWNPTNDWQVVFRGDQGLESMDVNRKTTWVLAANPGYRGPIYSPDGSKIATTFLQNDHWEVHAMNADGTGEVRLTETPQSVLINQLLQDQDAKSWNNAAPAWSPDGKQIAFISDRNGAYEIWVMNADGSNQHVLLPASALGGASIQYDGADERVLSWR